MFTKYPGASTILKNPNSFSQLLQSPGFWLDLQNAVIKFVLIIFALSFTSSLRYIIEGYLLKAKIAR
jgi:hypothetical protein